MRRPLPALALALLAAGCGGDDDARTSVDRDTLTRDQKDSITAESGVPGASGVGRALEARDRANERTQVHDTLQ